MSPEDRRARLRRARRMARRATRHPVAPRCFAPKPHADAAHQTIRAGTATRTSSRGVLRARVLVVLRRRRRSFAAAWGRERHSSESASGAAAHHAAARNLFVFAAVLAAARAHLSRQP